MNAAARAEQERAACRGVPNPGQVAYTAIQDAVELAGDLRQLDPRQLWGRLHLLAQRDPDRMIALCFALAAMVPVDDHSVAELLAWTDALANPPRTGRGRRAGRAPQTTTTTTANDARGGRGATRRRATGKQSTGKQTTGRQPGRRGPQRAARGDGPATNARTAA